jgi:hypothetical protein
MAMGLLRVDCVKREKKISPAGLFRKRPLMTVKTFSLIVMFAALAVANGARNAYAQFQSHEYEIKAAFLYNFAKFVEWPARAPTDSIIIGILGEDPFGGALETIEGKTIEGKKVIIKRFKSVRDLEASHILFIGPSERERLGEIMKVLKGRSALTVGEMAGFIQAGGVINFTIEGNKVHFEISAGNAEQAGVRLSSRLLKVATVVR